MQDCELTHYAHGFCEKHYEQQPHVKKRKSELSKLRYIENKDAYSIQKKKYYQDNKEEIYKKQKEYRQTKNGKKSQKRYYQKNKERISLRQKKYYDENKKKINMKQRVYRNSEQGKKIMKCYREEKKEEIKEKRRIWYDKNRDEILKKAKIYYLNNIEERKRYAKEYLQTPRGKEVNKASHIRRRCSVSELSARTIRNIKKDNIKKYGQLTCILCNEPIVDSSDTIEHIQPVSRGGDNAYDNLGVAHFSCNRQKSNKTMEEWVIYCEKKSNS